MAKNDEKYAYLNRLNTEQLEELLRMDMEMAEPGNEDVVFHILEVIEQREDEHPTGRIPDVDKAWAEFQEYYNIPEGVDASLYPCETEPDASSENPAEFSHPRRPRLHRWLKQGLVAVIAVAGWSRPKRRGSMCLVRLDAGLMRYSISCRQQMKITRPQVPMRVKTRLSIPICGRHLLLWRSMRVWPRRGSRMALRPGILK
jgi:hypothetical protein